MEAIDLKILNSQMLDKLTIYKSTTISFPENFNFFNQFT
jgi:hypothetical protein